MIPWYITALFFQKRIYILHKFACSCEVEKATEAEVYQWKSTQIEMYRSARCLFTLQITVWFPFASTQTSNQYHWHHPIMVNLFAFENFLKYLPIFFLSMRCPKLSNITSRLALSMQKYICLRHCMHINLPSVSIRQKQEINLRGPAVCVLFMYPFLCIQGAV